MAEEDRSALFNQLKNFSQRKLKKVETKVVTPSGENLVEKRGAKGLQVLSGDNKDAQGQEVEQRKLDLQVGLILPGLLIGAHDVAHDKNSLESYGVTHILNLDSGVKNKYEDDYNYKNVNMHDRPDYELAKVFDNCFDFIDDGRHYGNVLIHCNGAVGVSRSAAICVAYLMTKEKQRLTDALNTVKEARSFVRPNDGFMKQLKEYDETLSSKLEKKDDNIGDAFTLKKRQEIENEKAMVAGASSVKNRMKLFGATLDTNTASASNRAKSASPAPTKFGSTLTNNNNLISKSVTPEPKKNQPSQMNRSYMTTSETPKISSNLNEQPSLNRQTITDNKPTINRLHGDRWTPTSTISSINNNKTPSTPSITTDSTKQFPLQSNTRTTSGSRTGTGPPLPPPPPPASIFESGSGRKSTGAPPPPPPPPSSHLDNSVSNNQRNTNYNSSMKPPTDDAPRGNNANQRVFGRVPPPPMKLRSGVSMERQDSITDKTPSSNTTTTNRYSPPSTAPVSANRFQKSSIQLPLKKQPTIDNDGHGSSASSDSRNYSHNNTPSSNQSTGKYLTNKGQTSSSDDRSSSPAKYRSSAGDNKSSTSGLTRSSTKKILNLIKTKTKGDLTMLDALDENDEIEALLGALETDTVENIDWEELGLDEDEVKDIIKSATGNETLDGDEDDDSSASSSEEEVEAEDEEEEVETTTKHFVIRTRY